MSLRNCPICLECLSSSPSLAVLTCGHCYHEKCLKTMIATHRDGLCPLCGSQHITQCRRFRLGSTCMVCREGLLESPSKPMEVVAPNKELVHSECLRLLRHSEPFHTSQKHGSSYKLWGGKSITIKDHHRIYCCDEVTAASPAEEHDKLLYEGQKTFADDVAQCVFHIKTAILAEDDSSHQASKANGNASPVIILRKLRILAASCSQTFLQMEQQQADESYRSLRNARLDVFLKQDAIQTAIQTLQFSGTKNNNPTLWHQAAEFLAEVCFCSEDNSLYLIRSGGETFETMLLHPNSTSAFFNNFVVASLRQRQQRRPHANDDDEPALVQAGAIEVIVGLMRRHHDSLKVQLRGVALLRKCVRRCKRRVWASGVIAILRRHAHDLRPSHKQLQQQAISTLAAFGIYGTMIKDERLDHVRSFAELYGGRRTTT